MCLGCSVCEQHVCNASENQKRGLDPMELELY